MTHGGATDQDKDVRHSRCIEYPSYVGDYETHASRSASESPHSLPGVSSLPGPSRAPPNSAIQSERQNDGLNPATCYEVRACFHRRLPDIPQKSYGIAGLHGAVHNAGDRTFDNVGYWNFHPCIPLRGTNRHRSNSPFSKPEFQVLPFLT